MDEAEAVICFMESLPDKEWRRSLQEDAVLAHRSAPGQALLKNALMFTCEKLTADGEVAPELTEGSVWHLGIER